MAIAPSIQPVSKWDIHGLREAWAASLLSKDPSTQVGCYIEDAHHRPVSVGFNGFPQGIRDDDRLQNREEKYKIILHAEENAVGFANRDLDGCTVFTYPFMPCAHCTSLLIQKRVRRVVTTDVKIERWLADFVLSAALLQEAEIAILQVNLTEVNRLLLPTESSFYRLT